MMTVYTTWFSSVPFEELKLPIKGPMEDSGVVKLYEPSPTPFLYVVDVGQSPPYPIVSGR